MAQQVLDRYHVLRNMHEVVQRMVSRSHATLKQRQKDTGVAVRSRYKKKRSSSAHRGFRGGPLTQASLV
ncbi:MAG: hypothetical protein J2P36_08650 [Ktedonobacteraceae bacterium]|nr:hypothetical protein [Ktedonobacteraceae bacterium]